jgi:hypothetical protein
MKFSLAKQDRVFLVFAAGVLSGGALTALMIWVVLQA